MSDMDYDQFIETLYETCRDVAEADDIRAYVDQLRAQVAELKSDRQTLQRNGRHPAPCARHCEMAASLAEISLRDSQISKLENDKKLLHKAAGQLLKAWQEPSDKGEKLAAFDNYMTVAQRMGLYGGSE